MMDAELVKLARKQDDVVARWQLVELGWSDNAIKHRTSGFERLHDGVFITSLSPPTQRQLWRAATLTAPGTRLSHRSALACWGIRRSTATNQTVTRKGTGGARYAKTLLIHRSPTIDVHATTHNGISITTVPRTLLDSNLLLDDKELRKALREAIRLKLTSAEEILRVGQELRGSRRVRDIATTYASLPLHRCKSDAEAYGLEIDGPQWHRFKDEDARKTKIWRAARWEVKRIGSGDVFDHPAELISLVPSAP